jgi:hypothetical protein
MRIGNCYQPEIRAVSRQRKAKVKPVLVKFRKVYTITIVFLAIYPTKKERKNEY